MKQFHNIKLSVFCKEEEDSSLIIEKLKTLVPIELETEKINLNKEIASGVNDNKIEILSITLLKPKHIATFIDSFFSRLNKDQIKLLIKQIDSRVDDNSHFFIRIEKKDYLEDKIRITDSGNCFHFNFSIASYPANKKNATKIIMDILETYL